MGEPELRSGRLADAAGVSVQTLRYYERRGLLAAPRRSPGGHRLYPPETVTLLRVVKAAQRLGFTLDEVAGVLGRGRGAGLQGHARRKLADCVVCCGLPHMGRGDHDQFNRELELVQPQVSGLRRTGSAAMDLAWTAAGRFDAFWERNLSPWDMAAGIIMVREAGGYVSDMNDGEKMLENGHIVAGNELIRRDLQKLLKKA